MISILLAAGTALAVVLLGTPVAIHAFSSWGWGQRIREDGPHTHMEKMGTPTMGGIVILVGLIAGYLASRITAQRVTVTGVALVVVAVGFGVVGFLDDYAKVKRRRSLGLTKLQLNPSSSRFAGDPRTPVAHLAVVDVFQLVNLVTRKRPGRSRACPRGGQSHVPLSRPNLQLIDARLSPSGSGDGKAHVSSFHSRESLLVPHSVNRRPFELCFIRPGFRQLALGDVSRKLLLQIPDLAVR